MKRHFLSGLAMVIIVLNVMFVIAGCGGSNHTEPTEPTQTAPDEYVKVTYDGTEYTFRNGLSTEGGTAVGAKASGRDETYILGTLSPIADRSQVTTVSGVLIELYGTTAGSYSSKEAMITVRLNGSEISIDSSSPSLTVDKYEAVGGEITGTFSASVPQGEFGGDPKPMTCSFKVIRSADGTLDFND